MLELQIEYLRNAIDEEKQTNITVTIRRKLNDQSITS
jgi:hypothetical protein